MDLHSLHYSEVICFQPIQPSGTLEVPKPQIPRLWPRPYNKEDTSMPVMEEKQKARILDLSKVKNPPIREVTNSHPMT